MAVAFHLLIEALDWDTVKPGEIGIENDFVTAKE